MANRKVKPVSFNQNDTQESELLAFIQGKTFSSYIKQLIFLDMKQTSGVAPQEPSQIMPNADVPQDAVSDFY